MSTTSGGIEIVDFLLNERYLLTAFELLHELLESGQAPDSEPVVKLQRFFSDSELFPPDQLLHFQGLQADVDGAQERAAVLEYELRLAQEDLKSLHDKFDSETEPSAADHSVYSSHSKMMKSDEAEKRDLNCAVKEYLVSAGYKLTAITFCEEVDQDLNNLEMENALQKFYRAFHSSKETDLPQADIPQRDDSLQQEVDSLRRAFEASQMEAKHSQTVAEECKEALEQAEKNIELLKAEILILKERNTKEEEKDIIKCKEGNASSATHDEYSDTFTEYQASETSGAPVLNVIEEDLLPQLDNSEFECELSNSAKTELQTVQILADALPKIVPFVLINHREELLPLIICAIGRHPDNDVRDSLTHTLFNLIKRPDQAQRRIIMDACISLSASIGEMRTEIELLPQCWEQINHKHEERRLLVAQSCGELGKFVRSDMRSSLIFSILEQLVDDPTAVVREAAAHNLALLLPLFPNIDKYSKVEKTLFQLVLDPSGTVVEASLLQLVPSFVRWGNCCANRTLTNLLDNVLHHMLNSAQRCAPMSGVENSSESQLRLLGERERWNIEVLLRMLTQLLPQVAECSEAVLNDELVRSYVRDKIDSPELEWITFHCLPSLLKLISMLPSREETLRKRICKLLYTLSEYFGGSYHTLVVLPVFLTVVGDEAHVSHFHADVSEQIRGLKPRTIAAERVALKCVLPILLVVLGMRDEGAFGEFLKELLLQSSLNYGTWSRVPTAELVDAVRFLCTYEQHHGVLVRVLWQLVVNPNATVKVNVTLVLKELVAYADTRLVTQQLLPALITLGSDSNLDVKYASIGALGAVAQHSTDDVVMEKIRVQMDAFLDDGSNEATIAVIRALTIAVPLSAPSLRDYLLQKLSMLVATWPNGSTTRKRDKADVVCEALRSLDATGASVRDLLLPTVQSIVRMDGEIVDPAHREALEVILRERSGGKLDALTKAVGSMSSSMMNTIFDATATTTKKDSSEPSTQTQIQLQPLDQSQGMLKRMMRTNFGDMIRGRGN